MGSPIYMSPEQMRSARRVDGRADLWSVGVILYELLTGREPFSGDTLPALYQQILQAQPTPPSQLNPKVPHELDAVILRSLAKDREHRYATAFQLAAALAPFGGAEGRRMRQRVGAWTPNAASVPPPPPAPDALPTFQDGSDQQPTIVAARRHAPAVAWGARAQTVAPDGAAIAPWPQGMSPASIPPAGPEAAASPGGRQRQAAQPDAHAWPAAPAPQRGASRGAQLVVLTVLVVALIGAIIIAAIVLFAEAPARPGPARPAPSAASPSARDAGAVLPSPGRPPADAP
jgi:serine/threonine-protein kinase